MHFHISLMLLCVLSWTCNAGNYFHSKEAALQALDQFPYVWKYVEDEWLLDNNFIKKVKKNDPYVFIGQKGEIQFKSKPDRVIQTDDQYLFETKEDMIQFIMNSDKEEINKPLSLMKTHSEKLLHDAFKTGISKSISFILTQLESKKEHFPNMSRLQLLQLLHKKIEGSKVKDGKTLVAKSRTVDTEEYLKVFQRCAHLYEFVELKTEKQQLYRTLMHLYRIPWEEAVLFSSHKFGIFKDEMRRGEVNIAKIIGHIITIPNPMTLLADGVSHIGERKERKLAIQAELKWSPWTESSYILEKYAQDPSWHNEVEKNGFHKLIKFYYSEKKWREKYPSIENPLLKKELNKEEKKPKTIQEKKKENVKKPKGDQNIASK